MILPKSLDVGRLLLGAQEAEIPQLLLKTGFDLDSSLGLGVGLVGELFEVEEGAVPRALSHALRRPGGLEAAAEGETERDPSTLVGLRERVVQKKEGGSLTRPGAGQASAIDQHVGEPIRAFVGGQLGNPA